MKVLVGLVALAASSAAIAVQPPTPRAESDLVGCYASTTATGRERILLELREDKTYVAYTNASLGIWAKATGEWHLSDGDLLLGEPNEAQGWHYYMQPIHIRSGKHGVTLTAAADKLVARPGDCGL